MGQFNTFTFWDRTNWKIHPVVWNPWLLQTFSILYNCTRSLLWWSTGTSRGWWIFDLLIRRRSLAAYQNTSFHHHQWQKVSLYEINMLMWCDVSVMQKSHILWTTQHGSFWWPYRKIWWDYWCETYLVHLKNSRNPPDGHKINPKHARKSTALLMWSLAVQTGKSSSRPFTAHSRPLWPSRRGGGAQFFFYLFILFPCFSLEFGCDKVLD